MSAPTQATMSATLTQPAARDQGPERASPMMDTSLESTTSVIACSGSSTAFTTWLM